MPWINKEMCTGCEICVDECSAGAISMDEGIAFINEDECIRCGVCHDVCSSDAVRHDGERIPEEVESNLAWVTRLLEHEYYVNDKKKQKELIQRLVRYFAKNKKVIEETIGRLEILQNAEYSD
ncbi:MAG: 4Fe-4S binding protein [Deltaproteobacteria bacterium]|nr:4Fe-4S binding protein [Deltaproteobacteria bacterium]